MKGFIKCVALVMLFSCSVFYVQSQQPLVDVSILVSLGNLLQGLTNVLTFRSLFEEAAPILSTRLIRLNLTIILFPDIQPATQPPVTTLVTTEATTTMDEAQWTRKLSRGPLHSAAIIQEHAIAPAMRMEELLAKGRVTNLNGNEIVFERRGDEITANGHLITERDIILGDNVIAHRIAEPLATVLNITLGIVEAITNVLTDLLGIQTKTNEAATGFPGQGILGTLGQLLVALITNILQGLGLNQGTPLTFVAPDPAESEVLTKAFSTTGPLFHTPLLKDYIQKNTFLGSYSPHELMQMNEMTNLSGDKVPISKFDDGNFKIGDTLVNFDDVVAATNGYVYNSISKE